MTVADDPTTENDADETEDTRPLLDRLLDKYPMQTLGELGLCQDLECIGRIGGLHVSHSDDERPNEADVLSEEELSIIQMEARDQQALQDAAMYWQGRTYFVEAFLEQHFGPTFVAALRARRKPPVPTAGLSPDAITVPVLLKRSLNKAGGRKDDPPQAVIQMNADLEDLLPHLVDFTRLIDKPNVHVIIMQGDPTMIQKSFMDGGDQPVHIELRPPEPEHCQRCGASALDAILGPVDSNSSHTLLRCADTSGCDERYREASAEFEQTMANPAGGDPDNEDADTSEEDTAAVVENAAALPEPSGETIATNGIATNETWDQGPPPAVTQETVERVRRRTSPRADREGATATAVAAANGLNTH